MLSQQNKETAINREYNIVKHNDLIQKSRYNLSTQEQKIILYLVSKIKPDDTEFHLYEFQITEFCKVCGIETSGRTYSTLKDTVLDLVNKAFWVEVGGIDVTMRWIDRSYIDRKSGTIKIKLDELMKPYLLELQKHFTVYNLYFTLAMKSKYSLRIYELLKSYQNMGQCEFEIERLKKMLFAEKYESFKDFRVKVIEIAIKEINDFSDIFVTYKFKKQGRKVHTIIFNMKLKTELSERMDTYSKIENRLSPKQKQKGEDSFLPISEEKPKREGVLVYDSSSERWDICFALNDNLGGLDCDTSFEVLVNNEWKQTRLSTNENGYYLVGLFKLGSNISLYGQKVRI